MNDGALTFIQSASSTIGGFMMKLFYNVVFALMGLYLSISLAAQNNSNCQYDDCEIVIENDTEYDIQVKVNPDDPICHFFGIENSQTPNILAKDKKGIYEFSCDKAALKSIKNKSATFIISNDKGYCSDVIVPIRYGVESPELMSPSKENLTGDCSAELRVDNNLVTTRDYQQPYQIDFIL